MVNRKGGRFGNESADYDTITTSVYAHDTMEDAYANVPAWPIFDAEVRTARPLTSLPSWSPDNTRENADGWIKKVDCSYVKNPV